MSFILIGNELIHFGMVLNELFKVNLHRRGGLNPPDNINDVSVDALLPRS